MAGQVYNKGIKLTAEKSAGVPTPEDLALVNTYTLREFTPEEVYVRTFVVAHNAIDRDNEAFGRDMLSNLARTLPGKGLFEAHPLSPDGYTGMPDGLWFRAETRTMPHDQARTILRTPDLQFLPDEPDAVLLFASMFIPVDDSNQKHRVKLDAGLGFVSLGFSAERLEVTRDGQQRELTTRRYAGKGEALEGSLVWLGAQPGARAVKSADPSRSNRTMKTIEQLQAELDAAIAQKAATEATAKAAIEKAAKFDTIVTAFGAKSALLDNVPALLAKVEDGEAYKSALVEDLVAHDRATGRIVADTPEAVAEFKAAYGGMSCKSLRTMVDATLKGAGKPKLSGSDPNAGTPEGQGGGPVAKSATPPAFAGVL